MRPGENIVDIGIEDVKPQNRKTIIDEGCTNYIKKYHNYVQAQETNLKDVEIIMKSRFQERRTQRNGLGTEHTSMKDRCIKLRFGDRKWRTLMRKAIEGYEVMIDTHVNVVKDLEAEEIQKVKTVGIDTSILNSTDIRNDKYYWMYNKCAWTP